MTAAPPIPSYLVAAMRANPADDGLRLQVADFFEENGQGERAEFVRLSVKLPRLSHRHGKGGCELCRTRTKVGRLEGRLKEWSGLPESWYVGEVAALFNTPAARDSRGFLESATCPAADWLAHGDALYAREPVTAVTLTTWPTLYTYRRPGETTYRVTLDVNDAVGYLIQHDRITRAAGERALAARWPGVAFTLPPTGAFGLTTQQMADMMPETIPDLPDVLPGLLAARPTPAS